MTSSLPDEGRPRTESAARRATAAIGAALTIAAGLIVHARVHGSIGDIAGDALYAVLIYLLLVLFLPRVSQRIVAALALVICFGVEFLQLTDIPSTVNRKFPPAALALGQGFDPRDLLVYFAALVVVLVLDVGAGRSMGHPSQRNRLQR